MLVCACMYVCMYACMHACMNVCMYACMHVCMHQCLHVCMYACMYVCMHVCKYLGFDTILFKRTEKDKVALVSSKRKHMTLERFEAISVFHVFFNHAEHKLARKLCYELPNHKPVMRNFRKKKSGPMQNAPQQHES